MSTIQAALSSSVSPAAGAIPRQTSTRLLSIDVFRGLLVAGMILVTNPGTYDFVYWPLKHADWNGSTPTDMIFPSFLFLAGVSTTFSFASRLARGATRMQLAEHVLARSLLLILLGLFLNGFPAFDMHNLRIPGVLQRIGLCYLFGGLLWLVTSREAEVDASDGADRFRANVPAIATAIVVLLATYWALLRFVPVPGYGTGRLDAPGNLGAYIDRTLMGTNHLWFWGGQMWDPEGLLSTLTATANLLLGILAGEWLSSVRSERMKVIGMAAASITLMLAGLALNPIVPINKKIWTDSFMLFSGGFSLLTLALLHWLIDKRRWPNSRAGHWLLLPALIYGSNAILGFALANVLTPISGLIHFSERGGKPATIPALMFQWFSHFLNPWNASLAYAIAFVVMIMALLWPLYRWRIFVRL
jgi:predicted acyltransferase